METTTRTRSRRGRLRDAVAELLDREFTISVGHLIALVNGCAFAPSLLVFWAVNGVLDFSTAIALGATGGPGGLAVRIVAYLLLVPTFVLLRVGYYLVHPRHRRTVLAGSCPNARLLRLDWFSVGILATGLPFSLQSAGPWLAANVVFLVGVFLLPRALPARLATPTKLAALAGGSLLFLYANYGGLVPVVPDPAATLGVVATLRLSDATTATLVRATNSLLVGPGLVALFALAANRIMTRPELTSLPLVRRTLPTRDAAGTVATSAALGTGFYLLVVVLATGELRLLP